MLRRRRAWKNGLRPVRSVLRQVSPAIAAGILLAIASGGASARQAARCVRAGRRAEAGSQLPPGLLAAIARVESGRWDTLRRRVVPWPWAVDVAGHAQFFADKSKAVAATRELLQAGQRNIDVGCYQISLLHHPAAFSSLERAFDPAANARYAARFLTSLHERYGDWPQAVAAYHSADPALGIPYRNLVFAAWHRAGDDEPAPPVWQAVPSVHIWTPRAAGTAPRVIVLPGGRGTGAAPLPRVITPGP